MSKNYEEFSFSSKINLFADNEVIEKLSKKYIMSDYDIVDKMTFLKLKKEYYRIKNIQNYNDVQAKLYENKSRAAILSFELSRILKQNDNNPEVLEYISSIQSILSSYNGEISEELYNNVATTIIFLELSLGMKIGLFKEVCSIFESKLQDIAIKENSSVKRK